MKFEIDEKNLVHSQGNSAAWNLGPIEDDPVATLVAAARRVEERLGASPADRCEVCGSPRHRKDCALQAMRAALTHMKGSK
jgi:hypothetical protein